MSDPTNRDRLIDQARSFPDLISKAETFDPAFAATLRGKALAKSKTLWGTLAALGVAWAVREFNLGWDASISELISGLLVLCVAAGLRYVTAGPITGVVNAKPPAGSKSGMLTT